MNLTNHILAVRSRLWTAAISRHWFPLVVMDGNILATLFVGVANAGLSVGMALGLLLFFLRTPRTEARKKVLKMCPSCHRWQEVT